MSDGFNMMDEKLKAAGYEDSGTEKNVKPLSQNEAMDVPKDYVDAAEKLIKELKSEKENILKESKRLKKWEPIPEILFDTVTTSKLRTLLTLINDIHNKIELTQNSESKLTDSLQAQLKYLLIRVVYEAGREDDKGKSMKGFIEKANLIPYIRGIQDDRDKFIRFFRYMEALVAFHRYYGGKD